MHTDHLRGALFWSPFKEFKETNQSNQTYMALQAYGSDYGSIFHFLHHIYDDLKRVLLRWPVKVRATISIEASIAIPIFLFAFLEILSLLNCLSAYSGMLYSIKSIVDPISVYAYAYDVLVDEKGLSIEEGLVAPLIFPEGYLDARIKNNSISVLAHYETASPISFAGIDIPMRHYYFIRMWTGYEAEGESEAEEVVYITPSGEVYHIFRDCSHLELSIHSIQKKQVKDAQNEYGESYTNCPMCLECVEKEEGADCFYITQKGNKYHGNLACSALKRTVKSVPLEDVKDRPLCERCKERRTE